MPSSCLPCLLLALLGCVSDYDVVPEPVDVDPGEVTECGFSQVGDTDFWEYDCNPVFSTTDEDWAPTVSNTTFAATNVLGHPFYQMWYVGVPQSEFGDEVQGDYGLGYAVSADGTSWEANGNNPLLEEPEDPMAWDHASMDSLQVIWDPDTAEYIMVYQGFDDRYVTWGIGAATSPDGVNWTRSEANPVLDLTEGIPGIAGWCWPLGLSLGSVAGYTGYLAGYSRDNGPCEMYSFNASSTSDWEPSSDLVLGAGDPGAFDEQGFVSVAVAELEGTWYMFYAGFGDWQEHQGYRSTKNHFLGMATSSDGTTWTREAGPVGVARTQEGDVTAVSAYTVGNRIHLWLTDDYDGVDAVGYYLYDPHRTEADTGAAR